MPDDFERAWLDKFSRGLTAIAGEAIREEVLRGSDGLSSDSDRRAVIAWSQGAMARLEALTDEPQRRAIMTGCACQYPKAALQAVREVYQATGDVAQAHSRLQAQFEAFLRETLELPEESVAEIVRRGWGLAGVFEGDRIIATKMPKSGYVRAYLQEPDPQKRRELYCHCPRVRDALRLREPLSRTYCYCGAGFYKGIWEEILQVPVEVEVLESVLAGGEVCRIALSLP